MNLNAKRILPWRQQMECPGLYWNGHIISDSIIDVVFAWDVIQMVIEIGTHTNCQVHS